MANERTFLAWIRTALALIAAGVALEVLAGTLYPGLRLAAASLLILASLASSMHAWITWMRTERALRHAGPLPASPLALPLVIVVAIVALLVLLGLAFA